jgi:hypothetical protein
MLWYLPESEYALPEIVPAESKKTICATLRPTTSGIE